jgi:hypothetical protein
MLARREIRREQRVDAQGRIREWEVQGPGEIEVVSPAGGGQPALWDSTSRRFLVVDGELVEQKEADE